jgi:hypothetical protein
MIKLLIILVVGVGLGYTYGYMHGAAGDASIITSTLDKVGVHHAAARGAADADAERQARADSVRRRSTIRTAR